MFLYFYLILQQYCSSFILLVFIFFGGCIWQSSIWEFPIYPWFVFFNLKFRYKIMWKLVLCFLLIQGDHLKQCIDETNKICFHPRFFYIRNFPLLYLYLRNSAFERICPFKGKYSKVITYKNANSEFISHLRLTRLVSVSWMHCLTICGVK